jgi:hypothetical protein
MKFLKNLIELYSEIQIALSPILIGLFLGVMVYLFRTDTIGLTISGLIVIASVIAGWALVKRVKKKESASTFLGRVNASPELNKE